MLCKSIYSEKFLKTLYKIIKEFISCNVPDFFLLEQQSKGHWALKGYLCTRAPKAIGHQDTRGTRAFERHLGTRALKALGHLGTQELGHSVTRALVHSDNWALEALYLADSPYP